MTFDSSKNQKYDPRRPALIMRGGSRSSRTWSAGCGGRVGSQRADGARTNDLGADAKACGPGLPTLRPSSRVMISRAMGATKPGSQGERAISVKTIVQGMPDDSAGPVVTAACLLFAGGPWVAASTRHSLRPLFFRGCRSIKNSGAMRRENDDSCCGMSVTPCSVIAHDSNDPAFQRRPGSSRRIAAYGIAASRA